MWHVDCAACPATANSATRVPQTTAKHSGFDPGTQITAPAALRASTSVQSPSQPLLTRHCPGEETRFGVNAAGAHPALLSNYVETR